VTSRNRCVGLQISSVFRLWDGFGLVMPSLLLISVPNLSLFSLYCSVYLNLWHVDVEASQHLID